MPKSRIYKPWNALAKRFFADITYEPLNTSRKDIRVLVLEPGPRNSNDVLDCKLTKISLTGRERGIFARSSSLGYETISYCWGDASELSEIQIHGKVVKVPKSSEMALRSARHEVKKRILWIDAVCINQADIEERSQQVAMMADIYRNGVQNLVYLGEEDDTTKSAFDSIDLLMNTEIAEVISDGRSLVDTVYYEGGRNGLLSRLASNGLTVPVDQNALAVLYKRPWFSRRWVVQEVAMSHKSICHCGSLTIDMTRVLMVSMWLDHKRFFLEDDLFQSCRHARAIFDFTDEKHSLFRSGSGRPDMHVVIEYMRPFECADPLDKVFAILGLTDWGLYGGLPESLRPDYSKTLPELLIAVAYVALRLSFATNMVRSISHRSYNDVHVDGLPSWVARWHRKWKADEDARPFMPLFDAAGNIKPPSVDQMVPDEGHNFGRLKLEGMQVDVVEEVYSRKRSRIVWKDICREFLAPLRLVTLDDSAAGTTMFCTLVAGTWSGGQRVDKDQIAICKAFCSLLEEGKATPARLNALPPDASDYQRQLAECDEAITYACSHRMIAQSTRKSAALVPHITQPGDIIAIFFGAETPFILRPCGEEKYELIGECYIHGIMDGEAVEEWRASGEPAKSFTLI